MGLHIWAKNDLCTDLNWPDAAATVTALARHFDDHAERDPCDCDDDISPTAAAKLDAEAPADLELFRAYCLRHAGNSYAADFDIDGLRQIRTFIADCARLGRGITVSY